MAMLIAWAIVRLVVGEQSVHSLRRRTGNFVLLCMPFIILHVCLSVYIFISAIRSYTSKYMEEFMYLKG